MANTPHKQVAPGHANYPHGNRVRQFADAVRRTDKFELISAASKLTVFSDVFSTFLDITCTAFDVVKNKMKCYVLTKFLEKIISCRWEMFVVQSVTHSGAGFAAH